MLLPGESDRTCDTMITQATDKLHCCGQPRYHSASFPYTTGLRVTAMHALFGYRWDIKLISSTKFLH